MNHVALISRIMVEEIRIYIFKTSKCRVRVHVSDFWRKFEFFVGFCVVDGYRAQRSKFIHLLTYSEVSAPICRLMPSKSPMTLISVMRPPRWREMRRFKLNFNARCLYAEKNSQHGDHDKLRKRMRSRFVFGYNHVFDFK